MRAMLVLVLLAAAAGWTVVSSYGRDPQQIGPDAYSFTVYYGMLASPAEAEKKAGQYAAEFMSQHGYTSYEIENRVCDNDRGRCAFKIRFKK